MQADEAALEEVADGESLTPTVVVGIGNDEAGEEEEEVYRELPVVERADDAIARAVCGFGKGKSFVHMIP